MCSSVHVYGCHTLCIEPHTCTELHMHTVACSLAYEQFLRLLHKIIQSSFTLEIEGALLQGSFGAQSPTSMPSQTFSVFCAGWDDWYTLLSTTAVCRYARENVSHADHPNLRSTWGILYGMARFLRSATRQVQPAPALVRMQHQLLIQNTYQWTPTKYPTQ